VDIEQQVCEQQLQQVAAAFEEAVWRSMHAPAAKAAA